MAASTLGQPNYRVTDVRRLTAGSVVGDRWAKPVGACIHCTDGINSLSWLSGASAQSGAPASADVLISKRGDRWLLVPNDKYAYGVGEVSLPIRARFAPGNVNQYLISVELEYLAREEPSYAQYDSLAECIVLLAFKYQWRWPYVLYTHASIATPLGRRSDPTNFDIGAFMGRLYQRSLESHVGGLGSD